jgi:preprotein translocase SecE subunit
VISNVKQQIKDLNAELKRVDWPSKQKVLSATWAVLIVSALSGGYLFAADWVISAAMRLILPH